MQGLILRGRVVGIRRGETKKGRVFVALDVQVTHSRGTALRRVYDYNGATADLPINQDVELPVWCSAYQVGTEARVKYMVSGEGTVSDRGAKEGSKYGK